ncbi:hypothetical protein [Alkaliphilus transvaalensis]|uniref:hypothetical protein n=1 Tax=Alkaliphilus transvaalensis TaxID=114628 RepID=UPI0006885E04|nr:hypothetical protein [Alkaliphilus transvaalensis]
MVIGKELRPKRKPKKVVFILHFLIIFILWTFLVLYPNPYRFAVSIYRISNPAINPEAISHLLEEVPDDPQEIERYVLTKIPYQFDWLTYGVPFYFPTVEEVLANGTGDCKSRFVVLASIFEAKGISYRQSFSLSHFWVHYDGKEENPIELETNALFIRNDDGEMKIQLPQEDLKEIYEVLKEGFWDFMPLHRKFLFVAGLPMSIMIAYYIRKRRLEDLY